MSLEGLNMSLKHLHDALRGDPIFQGPQTLTLVVTHRCHTLISGSQRPSRKEISRGSNAYLRKGIVPPLRNR
jgi:hypothetical protein